MIATLNTNGLLELVWAAPLAVLVVTIAWGMVVHGSTRAFEASRDGRSLAAGLYTAEALAGGALFIAAVALGLLVVTAKG